MKRLPNKTFQNMMQFSGNCFILLVIASTVKIKQIQFMKTLNRFSLKNNLHSKNEVENCKTVKMDEDNYWLLKLIYGDAACDTTANFQIPSVVKLEYNESDYDKKNLYSL